MQIVPYLCVRLQIRRGEIHDERGELVLHRLEVVECVGAVEVDDDEAGAAGGGTQLAAAGGGAEQPFGLS